MWRDELVRVSGRLQASLSFVEIDDVLSQDVGAYLSNILQQCRQVHERVFRLVYPVLDADGAGDELREQPI